MIFISRPGLLSRSKHALFFNNLVYSVSVDKLPIVEYFVFFDSPVKGDQMKFKFYKTVSDGKWYDKAYSEEAELNSPEFGIPEMNAELKSVLDTHEAQHAQQKSFSA
jgi:hypothetical protein